MKKEKEKMDENYIKNGEKGLINASFWVTNSNIFRGDLPIPPAPDPNNFLKCGSNWLRIRNTVTFTMCVDQVILPPIMERHLNTL